MCKTVQKIAYPSFKATLHYCFAVLSEGMLSNGMYGGGLEYTFFGITRRNFQIRIKCPKWISSSKEWLRVEEGVYDMYCLNK